MIRRRRTVAGYDFGVEIEVVAEDREKSRCSTWGNCQLGSKTDVGMAKRRVAFRPDMQGRTGQGKAGQGGDGVPLDAVSSVSRLTRLTRSDETREGMR